MRHVAFIVLLLAFLVSALRSDAEPKTDATATVAEIVDGDTVVLDREIAGARQVRLVGLQAPKLPFGRPGFEAWPLANESRDALSALVRGREVTLRFTGEPLDRHGRLLAHLETADGTWVQGAGSCTKSFATGRRPWHAE